MILLNQHTILQHLKYCKSTLPVDIICLNEVDSTNNFLKTYSNKKNKIRSIVCCAETQTLGRGRHNRIWASPYGVNIYMSIRCQINCAANKLGPVSLITALACLKAFKKLKITLPIKIKWPNDLLYHDKKLGGILIEIIETSKNATTIIIGIGLNINHTPSLMHDYKPITSLYEQTGQFYDRNILIAYLINEVITTTLECHHRSTKFHEDWNQADYLKGKFVKLINGPHVITGTANGINTDGELIIKTIAGELNTYASGEAQQLHEY